MWLWLCLALVAGSGETRVPLPVGRAEPRSVGSFPWGRVAGGRGLTPRVDKRCQLVVVCQHLGPRGAEAKSAQLALLEEQFAGGMGRAGKGT